MDTAKKRIPIGFESFKRIIEDNFYYVDKTLFIKELVDNLSAVSLFCRPRRFGKTLTLSMLRYYFEKSANDNSHLFEGLKILDAGEKYTSLMGQFPVISLSMKNGVGSTYYDAFRGFCDSISTEFERHSWILDSGKISVRQKKQYLRFLDGEADSADYRVSLKLLSRCLHSVYKKRVIILIDEYDAPVRKALSCGYYNNMIDLINSFLLSGLKGNSSLEFAVIAGCLRLSGDSSFPCLNNITVNGVDSNLFSDCFGFTQTEVQNLLAYYTVNSRSDEFKLWYSGYSFGNTSEIFNPWSSLYATRTLAADINDFLQPFWSNSSSNYVIKSLLRNFDNQIIKEVETLISCGCIEKSFPPNLTYGDLLKGADAFWHYLYLTGYLTRVSVSFKNNNVYYNLKIPNKEILSIFLYIITDLLYDMRNREFSNKDHLKSINLLVKNIKDRLL